MKTLDKVFSAFCRVTEPISIAGATGASLCALAMMLLILTEIILRGVFNQSLKMEEEMSGYLLVAIGALGQGWTLKSGGHVRVEAIFSRLSPRVQRKVMVGMMVVALAYVTLLIWESVRLAASSLSIGAHAPTITETPIGWVQILLPIGLFLLALELIVEILQRSRPDNRG